MSGLHILLRNRYFDPLGRVFRYCFVHAPFGGLSSYVSEKLLPCLVIPLSHMSRPLLYGMQFSIVSPWLLYWLDHPRSVVDCWLVARGWMQTLWMGWRETDSIGWICVALWRRFALFFLGIQWYLPFSSSTMGITLEGHGFLQN